jgi:LysR family transcriptional regulator, regulator for metE and metH
MYIELRHLRTIRAIQQAGGLARAADMLNMTQSALSHQVKGLEDQAGMELFVRRSKPMRLSAAGVRMLRAAERILPEIDAMEEEFRALARRSDGAAAHRHRMPRLFRLALSGAGDVPPRLARDRRGHPGGARLRGAARAEPRGCGSGDLVRPRAARRGSCSTPCSTITRLCWIAQNPLAAKDFITAEDFRDQVLITYPVSRDKLDVFTEILTPAKVEPRAQRTAELTAVILMLVGRTGGGGACPTG